jgi:phosphoglycerate dehydrogenase-like enzyme
MTVSVSDRKQSNGVHQSHWKFVENHSTVARLDFAGILLQSTVIFVCVPRTSTTINMISAAEMALMRPEALLINVSRGGIVNESDLLSTLRAHGIAGAATDVFATEPAGTENSDLVMALAEEAGRAQREEKASLPLVITPHTAWYSEVTMENLTQSVKDNVEGWWRGASPPENVVV